jgi:serine kinase of HPr protein (carbohydrate metabolism regulator)
MTGRPALPTEPVHLHASCVRLGGVGVLLLGPPGSGKSDLVLRLLDQPGSGISGNLRPAELVADDRVVVRIEAGRIVAAPPPRLAGRLEIRGLGIVGLRHCGEVALGLAVRLAPSAEVERLPDAAQSRFTILGLTLPMIGVDPASASAPARIRAALDWLMPP